VGIAQIKKYVTGKGTSEKDRMMLSIYKDFHYEPADEHEADAVGVALTARGIMSGAATTAPQREVIASAHKNGHPLTEVGK
jgi:Holliday junction resolvasome RuvABC endonuclease subunit